MQYQTETEPGWKSLRLELPARHGPVLHVSADSAWSPRAAGLEDAHTARPVDHVHEFFLRRMRMREARSPARGQSFDREP